MIFSLNSAGVRVFFEHFFEKEFVMAEGEVLAASAGSRSQPLLVGHAKSILRGARLSGRQVVCVGVLCEGGCVC